MPLPSLTKHLQVSMLPLAELPSRCCHLPREDVTGCYQYGRKRETGGEVAQSTLEKRVCVHALLRGLLKTTVYSLSSIISLDTQQISNSRFPIASVLPTCICCCRGHPPEDADAGISFVSYGGTANVKRCNAWTVKSIWKRDFQPHEQASVFETIYEVSPASAHVLAHLSKWAEPT